MCKTKYFTLNGSQCDAHTFTSLANCSTFHPFKNECIKCKSNFTLATDGSCIAKVANCSLALADGTCLYCDKNYYESLGACVKTTIQGCVN